ncbi:MAG: hypothetical protein IH786_07455 [Proteobacteria bacterium]|nr:hypothetical protein [Pseudomonadota bacterium]
MLACNLSGPRRIKAGAARDHFLGVHAVSGRGEAFKSGGRVVKNVTGYDMCKLLAGSHGTLAVLTDVTVKVMPAPEKTRTVLLFGLDDAGALAAMTRALQSAHEVSAAAHMPAPIAAGSAVSYVAGAGAAVTVLRVEGPGPSVAYRCAALRKDLSDLAETEELLANPLHPYTRALLSAVPIPDPSYKRNPVNIIGDVASGVDPGPRCRFLDRCPIAGDECHDNPHPPLEDRGGGHLVACYRV